MRYDGLRVGIGGYCPYFRETEALDFLDRVKDELQSRMEALRDEIRNEE